MSSESKLASTMFFYQTRQEQPSVSTIVITLVCYIWWPRPYICYVLDLEIILSIIFLLTTPPYRFFVVAFGFLSILMDFLLITHLYGFSSSCLLLWIFYLLSSDFYCYSFIFPPIYKAFLLLHILLGLYWLPNLIGLLLLATAFRFLLATWPYELILLLPSFTGLCYNYFWVSTIIFVDLIVQVFYDVSLFYDKLDMAAFMLRLQGVLRITICLEL